MIIRYIPGLELRAYYSGITSVRAAETSSITGFGADVGAGVSTDIGMCDSVFLQKFPLPCYWLDKEVLSEGIVCVAVCGLLIKSSHNSLRSRGVALGR